MGFEQLNKMKIICLLNVPNLDFFLLPKASEFKKKQKCSRGTSLSTAPPPLGLVECQVLIDKTFFKS